MIELLAALSLSAAAGFRVALPLLAIGLLHGTQLWEDVPILSGMDPQWLLGILVSWSLSELVLSKYALGQRILQHIQLILSPVVGAIAGLTMAYSGNSNSLLPWLFAVVGALLALVLQLAQVGWFYRLKKRLPIWSILLQDTMCLVLVLSAFDAPQGGGLIALCLLWLAIRSSNAWQKIYLRPQLPMPCEDLTPQDLYHRQHRQRLSSR